jgi:hypothetical protein
MLIFGLIALALFAVTYVIFYRKRLGIKNYGSNYTNAIKREGDE